jgi:hypothetical protein
LNGLITIRAPALCNPSMNSRPIAHYISPIDNTVRSNEDGDTPLAEFFVYACIKYALLRRAA